MARPGGKEVGRVNIRAVPDGSYFRKSLKVMLERVERTVKVTLPVDADTRLAEANLRKFAKDWNGRKVSLAAAVTTGGAAAALRYLTRPRVVPISVRIRQATIARAQALIAALSGARVAGDLVKNLSERLQNLDRALPRAALVATSIANVVSVVTNALGGILSTGQGVVQLLGLLGAAPGIFAGIAVGGTALGLALVDVKKQLAVLAPGFQRLQDVVSNNFWAVARRPIIDFVRGTLPELQAGLARTATTIGEWSATVVAEIAAAFGGGRITAMFEPLIQSIQIAATGAGGFAQAIAVLGQVGGSYLPRLAQWVADLSNRFGAFLLQAESDGSLQRFIETGITAAKELGSVLFSLGSIFSGLTQGLGGGGGFGPLADGLARIAEIVNSEPFQTTLTTIFNGASLGAAGLADALGPIGAMLAALAPVIATILASSGQVVGQVLGQIASALSSPVFAEGLSGFFQGLLAGIQAVAPALPAIASALGSVLSFAGALAAQLGPVLGTVLAALAPILTTLLEALKPILPVLGSALIKVVSTLAPLIVSLVEAILPLVTMIGEQLGPVLEPLIEAFAALLPPIIQIVAALIDALMPALGPLLPLIAQIITVGLGPLATIITALVPVFEILAAGIKLAMTIIGAVVSTVVALLKGDFESIGKIWEDVWTGVLDFGKSVFNSLMDLLQGFINGAIDLINGLSKNLQPFLDGVAQASGGLISIKLSKIPHVSLPRLAIGADILPSFGGTAAILGEGGRPETVTDLGRTNRLIELANRLAARALTATSGSGGGDIFHVTESMNPMATAQAIARERNRRKS